MFWRIGLLFFGVWACGTAVVMIKSCTVHPVLLSSYRLLAAVAILSPLLVRDWRRHRGRFGWAQLRRTVVPGLLLGAHFITWIIGARWTLAANSSLIVNMVPVAMPFLLHFLIREKLTRGEYLATGLALAGVAVLAGADFRLQDTSFPGDMICVVSMLLLASYLALGRRNRDFPSIWLYLVPLYFVAGAACFLAALPFVGPLEVSSNRDWLMVLGLAAIPTVMGHSILNYSMKHIRGQAVSVTNLSQFIFAGGMAFLFLGEVPRWNFYVACVLVVAGAVLALRDTPPADLPAEA